MSGERQGFRKAKERLEKRLRDGGMSADKARKKATESARRVHRIKDNQKK